MTSYRVWRKTKSGRIFYSSYNSYEEIETLYNDFENSEKRLNVVIVAICGGKASLITIPEILTLFPNIKSLDLTKIDYDIPLFNYDNYNIDTITFSTKLNYNEEYGDSHAENCAKTISNVALNLKSLKNLCYFGDPSIEECHELQKLILKHPTIDYIKVTTYDDDYSEDFIPFLYHAENLRTFVLHGRSGYYESCERIKSILDILTNNRFRKRITLYNLAQYTLDII